MKQEIDAMYKNGLFRPLEPLSLPDQQRVVLTVESGADRDWLDQEALAWATSESDPSIPMEEIRKRLAQIEGSLADVVISERGEY